MLKKVFYFLIVVLIVIQFIPNELPTVIMDNKSDLLANNDFPEVIETQIKASCYDCHSNETVYPWYSYVAPVSFLVKRDTEEGRKNLNFSDWEELSKMKKAKALSGFIDEIEEGSMPFPPYLITHNDAKMSDDQKQALMDWADSYAESLFE
ncbi:MAG: heme-binding domain-containing protein [Flavobacteriales bacterium]|nr:heme-binding domain-containing protein [Flavobacteriales bacterium]